MGSVDDILDVYERCVDINVQLTVFVDRVKISQVFCVGYLWVGKGR